MPKIKIINNSDIKKEKSFDPVFFVGKNKIIDKYQDFFKGKQKKKFLDVVKVQLPEEIKEDDLIFRHIGITFNIRIATKNKLNKGKFLVFNIIDQNYTKEFILWFFSQKEIQNYLSLFTKGNIIAFLPMSIFKKLDIIYPTKVGQSLTSVNITARSEFKEVIKRYFEEYRKNIKEKNYLSASFLVGSICEAMLYQFLRDNGVKKRFLDRKMYGELLEIIGMMNLDIMNIDDFKKVKNFRNLIHPKNALKNIDNISNLEKEIEPTFNKIIKNFGI